MKTIKKLLSLLLCLSLMLSCIVLGLGSAVAYAAKYTPSRDSDFIVFDGVLEEYIGPGGDVVIPAYFRGQPLREIAMNAFFDNTKITSLVIPEGVEKIGHRAFKNCSNIAEIELPYSLYEVGQEAFSGTAITEITIPAKWVKVGYGAFSGCQTLSDIKISNGVKEIHANAFFSSRPSRVIFPESVELIAAFAFNYVTTNARIEFVICNPDLMLGVKAAGMGLWKDMMQGNWSNEIARPWNSSTSHDQVFNVVVPKGSTISAFVQNWRNNGLLEVGVDAGACNNSYIIQEKDTAYYNQIKQEVAEYSIIGPRTDLTFANPENNSGNQNNVDRDPTDSTGNNQSNNNSSANNTPNHTHSFGAWSVTASANCTDMGKETRTCSGCGATETKSTNALGHNFKTPTITKQPTCTETGIESGICTRCGKNTTNVIAALGHKIENYTVTLEATCTKAGKLQGFCLNCATTAEQEIPMKEHTYKQETVNGVLVEKCTVCSAIKENDIAENDSQSADANVETKKSNNIVWIIVGIVAVAVISGGVTFLLLKKKSTNKPLNEELPEETVDEIPTEENLD